MRFAPAANTEPTARCPRALRNRLVGLFAATQRNIRFDQSVRKNRLCFQRFLTPRERRSMKTFIQVSEIWVPSSYRTILEFKGGLYGPHKQFRMASERLCFGYDEGTAGQSLGRA